MISRILAAIMVMSVLACGVALHAQERGLPTQALVSVDAKAAAPVTALGLSVNVGGRKEPLSSWTPVAPAESQVALLIDDGLRESVGRELISLKEFINGLPAGVEVLIGYMENGRVVQAQPFTTDHSLAASKLRLPDGIPGSSASPYFCLSDFVKKWPGRETEAANPQAVPTIGGDRANRKAEKARFVLMITNGVDPYNGSTSVMNQDSPNVEKAISDAQRAGVAVYSIYYGDAGIGGASASLSGQSYLQELADATGGTNFYEGNGNPVSLAPFLTSFQRAVADTYIATFDAVSGKGGRDLVRLKIMSDAKVKLKAPSEVVPGNVE